MIRARHATARLGPELTEQLSLFGTREVLVAHLEAAGILLCFWKPTLRIVTHLDVDDGHADLLVDTVGEFLGRT